MELFEILSIIGGVLVATCWVHWRARRDLEAKLDLALEETADLGAQLEALQQDHGEVVNRLKTLRVERKELQAQADQLAQGIEAGVIVAAVFGLLLQESERCRKLHGEHAEGAQRAAEAWRIEADRLLKQSERATGRRLKTSLLRLLLGMVPFGTALDTVVEGFDIPETMRDLEEVAEIFEAIKEWEGLPEDLGDFAEDLEVNFKSLHGALEELLEPLRPTGKGLPDFRRLPGDALRFAKALSEFQETVRARTLYKQVLQASHPLAVERRKRFSSRAEFSRQVEIAASTIASLEMGASRPQADTVAKLAKGLGLTVEKVEDWFRPAEHASP